MCRQFVQCGSPSDTSAFFQVYSLKNGLVVSRGVRFRVTDLMGNANHDPHGPLPTDSLHFETCVGPGRILGWAFMPCTGPQTLTKLSLLMLIWRSLISHSVSNPFLTSAFVYLFVPPLSAPPHGLGTYMWRPEEDFSGFYYLPLIFPHLFPWHGGLSWSRSFYFMYSGRPVSSWHLSGTQDHSLVFKQMLEKRMNVLTFVVTSWATPSALTAVIFLNSSITSRT